MPLAGMGGALSLGMSNATTNTVKSAAKGKAGQLWAGNCVRCMGTGKTVFRHVDGGICYACMGTGNVDKADAAEPARKPRRHDPRPYALAFRYVERSRLEGGDITETEYWMPCCYFNTKTECILRSLALEKQNEGRSEWRILWAADHTVLAQW